MGCSRSVADQKKRAFVRGGDSAALLVTISVNQPRLVDLTDRIKEGNYGSCSLTSHEIEAGVIGAKGAIPNVWVANKGAAQWALRR